MKRTFLLSSLIILSICANAQWLVQAPLANSRGQHGAVAHMNGKVYV